MSLHRASPDVARHDVLAAVRLWNATTVWRWGAPALVLVIAVVLRHFEVANTDVTWLFTLSEKVLDGQRPYVDFIEVNPPASILLYLPAVVAARLSGLSPGLVMDAAVFAAALGSAAFTGRLMLRTGCCTGADHGTLLVGVLGILLVLPAQTFAEREHIAVIAMLPILAVFAARGAGVAPAVSSTLFAGLAAGAAVCIKPHFVLGLAPAAILAAVHARSWRRLFGVETWACGAVVLAYAAVVLIAFPQFVSGVIPIVTAVYVPVRLDLVTLVLLPPSFLWSLGLMAAGALGGRMLLRPPCSLLLVASVGFGLAFFIQGKGWPYHSYPSLALVLMAVAYLLARREPAPDRHALTAAAVMTAVAVPAAFLWMNLAFDLSALAEPIRRLHPHPRMLAITSDPAIGHPLVRAVGGKWVQSNCGLWITAGAALRRRSGGLDAATLARLARYAERDRDTLVADIRRNKPDIILVDRRSDWDGWIRSQPEVQEALEPYRAALTTADVVVRVRRDAASP